MAQTVRVNGLKELTRAFGAISQDLSDEVRDELLDAVAPVKDRAEQLALSRISNMPRSPEYAEMRTGVSKARGVVYMVPAWRTTRRPGRKRKDFAELLLSRAMDPAVDEQEPEIIRGLERALDRLAGEHGF
jgi:hypothetical protein